jgi:hypothetical protein
MKNLFLSLVLVMVGLVANSQVFVVKTDTIQKFQHPKEVNFIPSLENGLINYTKLGKGEVVYTIDVDNKSLTMKNGKGVMFNFIITEVFKNPSKDILVSFECVDAKGFKGVVVLYKSDNKSVNMLVEYGINDETTEGYMCFDVKCKKKNPR